MNFDVEKLVTAAGTFLVVRPSAINPNSATSLRAQVNAYNSTVKNGEYVWFYHQDIVDSPAVGSRTGGAVLRRRFTAADGRDGETSIYINPTQVFSVEWTTFSLAMNA